MASDDHASKAPANIPPHLPRPFMDPAAYDRLYAFNSGVDDYLAFDSDWQQIRIRSGLTEIEVYRMLPHAKDFEFGGHLTKSRIRYLRCGETQANSLMSRTCTFHSHPTAWPAADLPSLNDIYMFLAHRHLRAVTVGATRIWVWDKTRATMSTVRKLGAWSEANLLTAVSRLMKSNPNGWELEYFNLALTNLGLDFPKKLEVWERNWVEQLRKKLKIRVRVFQRNV